MGYFSNGTEGSMYEDHVCRHCVHYQGGDGDGMCPVWQIHMTFNYEQGKSGSGRVAEIMGMLIPRSEKGTSNEDCRMFVKRDPNRCRDTLDLFDASNFVPEDD